MKQPTLFDCGPYTNPSLARTADPLSSHDAAERMVRSGKRIGNALLVLGALARQGPCTARELTGWMWGRGVRLNKPSTGDLYHEVVRRLHDLHEHRLASAELNPKRCCAVSGNMVQVWEAGEEAIRATRQQGNKAARQPGNKVPNALRASGRRRGTKKMHPEP